MDVKEKFLSRKFILSLLIICVASAALFVGVITGTEFVSAAGLIMGLYGASNSANAFAGAKAISKIKSEE